MKNKYDVIIVGAGIAGTKLALEIAPSGNSVLLVEKNSKLGTKACGHGITMGDISFFEEQDLSMPFGKVEISYGNIKTIFPKRGSILASVDREKYLENCLADIRKYENIDVVLGAKVEIISGEEIMVNSNIIHCQYLVGADGSASAVRRFLGLKTKKMGMGLSYLVPERYDKFEMIFDKELFGSGYAWIFPNKKFTSIGCGAEIKSIKPSVLLENFNKWLKERKIDVGETELKAAAMSYDYCGYKFDSVYLIGDAAGLISGLTGKGIFAALISAKQVAREILGRNHGSNLIKNWLRRKRRQEVLMKLLIRKSTRIIALPILLIVLKHYRYKQLHSIE